LNRRSGRSCISREACGYFSVGKKDDIVAMVSLRCVSCVWCVCVCVCVCVYMYAESSLGGVDVYASAKSASQSRVLENLYNSKMNQGGVKDVSKEKDLYNSKMDQGGEERLESKRPVQLKDESGIKQCVE
jgi:Fe-S-cluster-containing hydrogenase component 2